jgi:hypothetical protein
VPRSPLPTMEAHLRYPGIGIVETKEGGSKGTRRKPDVHKQTFLSLIKLTRIRCWMFRQIEANVSCCSLLTSMTCEHTSAALSPTCIQSIDGCGKPGEPDRSNLDTPWPIAPEDPGHGVVSPGAALLGAPMLAPSTSTLMTPSDVPSAPSAYCTSSADSSGASIPRGTNATKGKYGGVTRCATCRWTTGAYEV